VIKKDRLKILSLVCLLICVLSWVPNIFFQVASPLWMVTFIIAPIGLIFATMIKKYWLIAANTIMFFSFFIFMFVGNLVNYNLG